ncbi:hypothetical protein LX36DRAFT_594325, partial [Colletotrichum falcatum]
TLWLLLGLYNTAATFSALLLVKLGIFLLKIQGKRWFLLAALRNLSLKTTSGIISCGFF